MKRLPDCSHDRAGMHLQRMCRGLPGRDERYLAKPIDLNELERILKQYLSEGNAMEERPGRE